MMGNTIMLKSREIVPSLTGMSLICCVSSMVAVQGLSSVDVGKGERKEEHEQGKHCLNSPRWRTVLNKADISYYEV